MMVTTDVGTGPEDRWLHARGTVDLRAPRVMAVLNATPDSFFDGGRLHRDGRVCTRRVRASAEAALAHGADLLDIGGESTRPGAVPVDPDEERDRVLAAIESVADLGVTISCDTRRASVAAAAIDAGAAVINDVSGLQDPRMARLVAERGAGLVIGHLRGTPATMQDSIGFDDLLADVGNELAGAVRRAMDAGVAPRQIVVDPGVGFGKTAEQSAALVGSARTLRARTGCPVLIGASRKSFIGALTGAPSRRRLPGSLAAAVVAAQRGASVIRVHDVEATVQALAVAHAIARARGGA